VEQPPGVDPPGSDPAYCASRLRAKLEEAGCHVWNDHANYYSCSGMRDLLLGTGAAAVLANTRLDADFQEWYQSEARNPWRDDLADFWKTLGNGWILIPAFAGTAVVGEALEDYPLLGRVGQYGERTTRAYLVGAPPMLLMQQVIGSTRPADTNPHSHWSPFETSNGVSGHAFMGAVPFITAAKMVEDPWAKGGLYFCSTMTAWARVNDNRHYLSQAGLGWWMAYLACRAVDETAQADGHVAITPLVTPEMTGIGVTYQR
jgi:hypothetical protein